MKVYIVMVSNECSDNYYPDYDSPQAVFSTREKAENYVQRLDEENKDEDPMNYSGSWILEMELDQEL